MLVHSLSDFLRLSSLEPRPVDGADDELEVFFSRGSMTPEAEERLVSTLVHAWRREHRHDIDADVTAARLTE